MTEMGAMVGMAVADSVGAFLEFLPVGKKADGRMGHWGIPVPGW